MAKRILFLNRYPLNEPFHLKVKFDGQIEGARALGYETVLIAFDRKYFYSITKEEKKVIGRAHASFPFFFHILYYIEAGKIVARYLKNERIDIVYYRGAPGFYSLYQMAKAANENGSTLVCEIPSYYANPDQSEKELSIFRKAYSKISGYWQDKINEYVTLYALIGDKNESGLYRGKPSVNITNAINVDTLKLRNPINESAVHILALGSMGDWHGFDRLIRAVAEYKGNREVIIHIVGNNAGGCLEEWKSLSKRLGTDDKVIFHGPLYGADLDQMFDLCDIGVSSLGAYRNGVQKLASLKLREYAARGLPFVYAADDSSIDGVAVCKEFTYKIANDGSTPDMKEILSFADRVKQNVDLPAIEREYARENMQWQEQFNIIFNALKKTTS